MIAQISAVNKDVESGNLVEIMVFDGKTVAQATEFPSREPYYYFHKKLLIIEGRNFTMIPP